MESIFECADARCICENYHLIDTGVAIPFPELERAGMRVRCRINRDVAAIPLPLGKQLVQKLDAFGQRIGQQTERIPALPGVRHPPERRVAVAADDDRRMGMLYGLRVKAARRQVVKCVVAFGDLVAPQSLDHV